MDRSPYQHELQRTDNTIDEVPVSAREHHLTFLMSYPIWGQGKRAKKSRSHIADAILFLASGSDPTARNRATEPSENVRVFAPYAVKRKKGSRSVLPISVVRDVTFHDLNLTIPGDATVLEQRVTQAAQDVCRELDCYFGSGDGMRHSVDHIDARRASVGALAEIQL